MILRTKGGEIKLCNKLELLDFLGVKKETVGIHKISADLELIAGVPFQMNKRSYGTEKLSMSNEDGFAWTLSSFDLDRYGERIDPHGWDFSQYMRNPVVEWAHRFDIPAIGKIDNLVVDDKGLHGVVVFNDKSFDPFAWSIEQRIKAGSICAGSVGFRALEIEIPSKDESKDGTCLIFRKQELLEFSICNVPANPFALSKEKREGKKEESFTSEDVSNTIPFWGGLFQMRNEK